MMKNFFNPLPQGNFKMYCIEHILYMIISVFLIYRISVKFKNLKKKDIKLFLKITAIIMLIFDPIYWIWEYQAFGFLRLETTLPLYICSLFWMLMPFVAFYKENSYIYKASIASICTVCLFGGVFGIVFNVHLNIYPFLSFVPIRSLVYHFIMVLVPVILWTTGYYKPQIEDVCLAFIPFAILGIPSYILDKKYGWDYYYFNGGIGTPLEIISSRVSNLAFCLIVYISFYLLINFIFYLPTIFKKFKKVKIY